MNATRIAFPDPAALDAHVRAQLARRPPVDLYRMVAHAPTLLGPFLSLVVANFTGLSLPPAVREAVILRVGAHHGSAYEIYHHRRMAATAGLAPAVIEQLLGDAPAGEFGDGLAGPIALADRLLQGGDIDEALVQTIARAWGERGYVELALLVGFYRMVATFLHATGVGPEPDDRLAGWTPPAT